MKPPMRLWESSVTKWKTAIAALNAEKASSYWFYHMCLGDCGFCVAFGRVCRGCPLYPKTCSNYFNPISTLWKIRKEARTGSTVNSLRLSRLMLRAIRRHRNKFEEGQ